MLMTRTYSKSVSVQLLYSIIGIFGAVALPQAFHIIGYLTGTGKALGVAFSPMHLPVLALGLTVGPIAGLVTGLLAPVVSFGITGMPYLASLPLMVVELGVYGLVSGLLADKKMPVGAKIVISQIAGRIAYMLSVVVAVYLFADARISVISSATSLLGGLYGVLLQLIALPVIVKIYDKLKSE